MDRIVDVTGDGRHLHRHRGFMLVSEGRHEVGRVALDEILAVIVHAHGVTYTNSLLVELAQRGAVVVLCAANHHPVAILWSLEGHHSQGSRMRAQWRASRALSARLWKLLVVAKLRMQAAVLRAVGQEGGAVEFLTRKVRSGDPENVEAQAARRYWPLLMGVKFRRDRNLDGANTLLNYGYTVLRAATARAVVASGLNPTIGLHHHNHSNAFALADDLMEPFRPFVDCVVSGLLRRDITELNRETKRALVDLIALDLDFGDARTPVSGALQKLTHSVATSFENGKANLALPSPPPPLQLTQLGSIWGKDDESK